MVLGQFHDEGSCIPGEGSELLQHDAAHDDGGKTQEVEERRHPPSALIIAASQGTEHQRDDGQLRAAGDHGGGHDGHASVLLVLDGLGGHDRRHTAAAGDEHRDERFARQAEAPEDAVHDEGYASHVSTALQEAQEQEEDDQLRDEPDDRPNTRDDAINHKADHPRSRIHGFQCLGDHR